MPFAEGGATIGSSITGARPIDFSSFFKHTRPLVFWPPAIILVLALISSLVDFDRFLGAATAVNQWTLDHFDWLFSGASFAAVLLVAMIFASPLGGVRIGGKAAKPILKRWNWFAITLCTTIATGILFWGAAEPMFHLHGPPAFSGAEPRSADAARFALSTVFMHWSITPYAIYAVPALAFALAYYNLGKPYSLSGPLSLVYGRFARGGGGAVIDAIALFALVAGVSASLGAGVMTLVGGLGAIAGVPDTVFNRLLITAAIVATYVASSISGLQKGIKFLSDINIRVFFALVAFVLIAGPTAAILTLGVESVGLYIRDFLPRSLNMTGGDSEWTKDWTIFFFANWLAWAPITALFLGRIAVGYTVREFLIFNMLAPAFFGIVWMTVFGGAAINLDIKTDGALYAALESEGPEAVAYVLFAALPFTAIIVVGFVFSTFISFVTAMDSNTHSIAGVCLRPLDGGHNEKAALGVKIFWGALIGAIAWVMTSTNGIDGIRMLSNLGGLPGLAILISCIAVLVRFALMDKNALNNPVHPSAPSSKPH